MAEPFIRSTIRGRLGRYTLYIERDNLGSGESAPTPIVPEIETISKLSFGEGKLGYNPEPIIASFFKVTFKDRTGVIRDTFSQINLDELDYPVTLSGPNFLWYGSVRRGLTGRPTAPRVHTGLTTVYCYDRLTTLKEVDGIPTEGVPLKEIIQALCFQIRPLAFVLCQTHLLVENALDDPHRLGQRVFDGLLVGEGRGDHGTGWEQMTRICESHGSLFFQNFRTGQLSLVHRAAMPFDVDNCTEIQLGGLAKESTATREREADIVTILPSRLRAENGDEFTTRAGLGSIVLEDAGAINWVTDGQFLIYTGTDWLYWEEDGTLAKVAGTGRVTTPAPGGGGTLQIVGDFEADVDVRPRLRFNFAGTVRSRIHLYGFSGTEYWVDNTGTWQTTQQTLTFNSVVLTQATHIALEDFPESGTLEIEIFSVSFNNTWGNVELVLVDASNIPIDDWTVRIGSSSGESIRIKAVPELLAIYNGAGDTEPAEIVSEHTGQPFSSVNEFMAFDRLEQDIPGIDNLSGAVAKVVGPEAVLLVQKDTGDSAYMIANGADIDLVKGVTQGVWLEVPVLNEGLDEGSGSGS